MTKHSMDSDDTGYMKRNLTHDDPTLELAFRLRLMKYVPYIRQWWLESDILSVRDPGWYDFPEYNKQQPMIWYKVSRSPANSVIKGVQAFPFIKASSIEGLPKMPGGLIFQCLRIFGRTKEFKLDEFRVTAIRGIPGFETSGAILIFVPDDWYGKKIYANLGRWIYVAVDEFEFLKQGIVPESTRQRLEKLV